MYPEQRFRHRQDGTCHVGAHPRYGTIRLGVSERTMASDGCLVTCCAYLMSRFYGRDVDPGDLVTYLNQVDGFTDENHVSGSGLLIWKKFTANTTDAYPDGALRYSNRYDKTYTIRAVIFGKIVHWVVELRGGLAFDPWTGDIVVLKEQFASRRWLDTSQRRYIKAMRKPAT